MTLGWGGSQNIYGGPIVPEAGFPCSVFIDWVKVYALGNNAGVDGNPSSPGINIFPNPANDVLRFQLDQPQGFEIRITDISGKTVLQSKLDQSAVTDISSLKAGVYMVWLSNGKITLSKKLVLK